ncbi:MAG: hypothetical protein A3D26_03225 [Candidatus Blackburnbacteria bacterium RIFCSPHIGHO2_02_FULL_44_20]|uniref:Glycosyltransferase RgtA/B/C/D-like domain-containing protein n=1 Tax=Candidatus Blackburnbacteria bacterium RIFCSPHIGHO2_02_FULL_44_20 TaxID=1797516 RepID=A0A1G1V7Z0_9BACT|nr:MAG: hypothetical protein A3E16_01230 [Candidatus Blackburnbacteria bacterium RIFCSPHIGHO2_12_FULL_44_25]OGY11535.1 MAG: hypothetical protein A3D26_03225 [Candidatus Blackburnbacteria bacterium RIFCSPHIGHO2_02_FULL_44_20]
MKLTFLILLLLITFHLFLLANLQFTAWPEMLSYPYLKNSGFLLYKDMIHPYPPVLTLTLSYLYKFFGANLNTLRFFSWCIILSSDLLVWLVTKEISKKNATALIAVALYVLTQPFLEGNMMWFDVALVPLLLLGALFLLRKNLLLSGIFLALAGFTKQTGGLFYLAMLVYVIWHDRSAFLRPGLKKSVISFLFGPLIFGGALLVRLIQEGALEGFWKWVIFYPSFYWSKFPNYVLINPESREWFLILLLFIPTFLFFTKNRPLLRERNWQIMLVFLSLSVLSVYPRFSFFHFQTTLAFLSITSACFLVSLSKRIQLVVGVAFLGLIYWTIWPWVRLEWNAETRFYGKEDLKLSAELKDLRSNKIFLQGLQSGLYALSSTTPPKPWSDNFGWYLEMPGVQEEIITKWEENPPDTVVWRTPSQGNWHDLGTYQPTKIVNWISKNYMKEKELQPGIWVWRKIKI